MNSSLSYHNGTGRFIWRGTFELRHEPQQAGFHFEESIKLWTTNSSNFAYNLHKIADNTAKQKLKAYHEQILLSHDKRPVSIIAPAGLKYLPFQGSGIRYASKMRFSMIADEMGLGKTIQSIGLANLKGYERLLIICPASLRYNWERELLKWHLSFCRIEIYTKGSYPRNNSTTVITSYELAVKNWQELIKRDFDLVIIDEAHYIKSPKAKRTKAILGFKQDRGLISLGKQAVLNTGTPIPNRAHEFFGILKSCAPKVIDGMSYRSYMNRFCIFRDGPFGLQIVGSKNQQELNNRLRANFMIRRLKKDVLPDLPDKTYKLVTFAPNSETAKVLKKEKEFSAAEIVKYGIPVGDGVLPEIRREMAIAKVPQTVSFIKDMFENGLDKIIIFGYHIESNKRMFKEFEEFNPVIVIGASSPKQKQLAVDRFQTEKDCKVFIGNHIAAGTGWTLTASNHVYMHESSWVPGENEQSIDRSHRISQLRKVQVIYSAVEGSLDAYILSRAVDKQQDINLMIN